MDVLTREERNPLTPELLPLFRPEANGRQGSPLYGEIVLMRPVSLAVLVWLVLAFFVLGACVLAFGHYTARTHVTGLLLPDRGILKIFATQAGMLVECHARNGQRVHKGDALFVLSSDRSTAGVRSVNAAIREEMAARRESLLDERAVSESLSAQQAADLQDRLSKLQNQQAALDAEIRTADAQLQLAQQTVAQYRQLTNAQLISVLDLREKEKAPLEQQKTLEELQRSRISLEQERKDLQFQLERLPLQLRVQNASLERAISELDGQLNEQDASHRAVVRAPADGTLAAVLNHVGMSVDGSAALASLVPTGAQLEAHLYAPSGAIGFLKAGETALLRYRAYPSEHFGQQMAKLEEVSPVALSPSEYAARTGVAAQEPMYEMVAILPAQSLQVFGQSRELWPGMELDADILLERRKLVDWLFAPIVGAKGRFTR